MVERMNEAVSHYISSHPGAEGSHVDANTLSLNVQEDSGGRLVTVMHSQSYQRPVPIGESVPTNDPGGWNEELLDPDGKLAAIVAHLAQQSRSNHHAPHHKVALRTEVDSSVLIDAPMRLFNSQPLEQQDQADVVNVQLPSLPPLQMKRLRQDQLSQQEDASLLSDEPVLEMTTSPAQSKQNKKSLPHKKRISRKLKRNNGASTPHQDIVVINCGEEVQQEEILPDNFVTSSHHPPHHEIQHQPHHLTHEVRPLLICQLCGEFYGEEQLKFYHHLKQHYEPHATIIIDNPVPDLGIDKMANSCIVDNVSALPDSLVELSLENTMSAKTTLYQPIDKHILYSSHDKNLNYNGNKVLYTVASIDKLQQDQDKNFADSYPILRDTLEKVEVFSCMRCNKSFRKQRHCEAHIKEAHSKLEEMSEFSEPEDLMEGIQIHASDAEAEAEGEAPAQHYDAAFLPHLTVENGHVHQENNVRQWYQLKPGSSYCPMCPESTQPRTPPSNHLKEEVFQRMFDVEVPNQETTFNENLLPEEPDLQEETPPPTIKPEPYLYGYRRARTYACNECSRVFKHRNSLIYHTLSHKQTRPHQCRLCSKAFYTASALKIHSRVHNGDKPYKCTECGRYFRQWGDLKYHMISIHTAHKAHKCEFCGKEFARKYSLSLHRRIHTNERNYKCDYCNKGFRASSYKIAHMRIHTGEKPHKCQVCGKAFRVAADMRRHMLIHDKTREKEPKKRIKQENMDDTKVKVKKEVIKKVCATSTFKPPVVDRRKRGKKEECDKVSVLAHAEKSDRSDVKEREGETIENGFMERLTEALYNISDV